MPKEKNYDAHCEELAQGFLDDFPEINNEENLHELAQTIQDAIEEWFATKGKDVDL